MIVSLKVAKFLKEYFKYNLPTIYVYDCGERRFSIENCKDPIPAPSVMESVEFLWEMGIKIYNIPEKERSVGIIQIGERKICMANSRDKPTESYQECLEFLCNKWN